MRTGRPGTRFSPTEEEVRESAEKTRTFAEFWISVHRSGACNTILFSNGQKLSLTVPWNGMQEPLSPNSSSASFTLEDGLDALKFGK